MGRSGNRCQLGQGVSGHAPGSWRIHDRGAFSADAWNNVTFTAGEIRNPRRNLPLSLVLGTGSVIILYLLANLAYLSVLPVRGDPELFRTIQKIDADIAEHEDDAAMKKTVEALEEKEKRTAGKGLDVRARHGLCEG